MTFRLERGSFGELGTGIDLGLVLEFSVRWIVLSVGNKGHLSKPLFVSEPYSFDPAQSTRTNGMRIRHFLSVRAFSHTPLLQIARKSFTLSEHNGFRQSISPIWGASFLCFRLMATVQPQVLSSITQSRFVLQVNQAFRSPWARAGLTVPMNSETTRRGNPPLVAFRFEIRFS
jgi:hypothetical protein